MPNSGNTPNYTKLLSLEGQGFVVLGSGQGMGEQAVVALSQLGANVLCVDLNAEAVSRVASANGAQAMAADVTRRDQILGVFEQAKRLFGANFRGVVDIVGGVHAKDLANMTEDDWARQFDLDFKHAYLTIQQAAPMLAANGGGTMVFMGSLAGTRVRTGRMLPYAVAKAALNQLVQGSAKEWARKRVRMNVVAPGLVRSARLDAMYEPAFWTAQSAEIPMGLPAQDADIAAAVVFYCTAMSKHITGTLLAVDGGSHMNNESTYVPRPAE